MQDLSAGLTGTISGTNPETNPGTQPSNYTSARLARLASLAALALAAGLAGPALAQDTPPVARPGDALAAMIGSWEGQGWSLSRSQERETFDVFERVESVAGGHLVMLRGQGFAPAGQGRQGRPVHDAGGVVSLGQDGGYTLFAATADNGADGFEMQITETGYTWEIPLGPHGRVVYEAHFTADSWTETGQYCDPTGQCYPTLSMTLTRVAE